jgi:hypothetical protein
VELAGGVLVDEVAAGAAAVAGEVAGHGLEQHPNLMVGLVLE